MKKEQATRIYKKKEKKLFVDEHPILDAIGWAIAIPMMIFLLMVVMITIKGG